MICLKILHSLDGLNEYTAACRANARQGARMKKKNQALVYHAIMTNEELRGKKLKTPIYLVYEWIEKNKRRDKDNIAFAKKFIQDALVECGLIKTDGWAGIEGFQDRFLIDPWPGVNVYIFEDGEEVRF